MNAELYTKCCDVVTHYIRASLSDYTTFDAEEKAKELSTFVFRVGHDLRFHSLFTPGEAEAVWNEVRESELVTDFVLKLRTRLLCHLTLDEYNTLVRGLIDHFTPEISAGDRDNVLCLIDDVLLDRMPDQDFLGQLLKNNAWIVPLYLISTIPLSDLLEE